MEVNDKIIVKWAQEDVETSNNLLNNNKRWQYNWDKCRQLMICDRSHAVAAICR